MPKPQMPNMPGVGAVADTLDFVKNLWGSMSVPGMSLPGMAAPAMSVEELEKKIADLKAVEAWLNVNLSMLRGTIQALEIQRGTIATLKSMGATLANAVKQPGANEKSVLAAAPYASAFFAQSAVEPVAKAATPPEPTIAAPEPAPAAATAKQVPAQDGAPANPMANPAAWWNLLQDQFKHAVSTAMSSEAMANAQGAASKLAESHPALKMGKAIVTAVKPTAKKAAPPAEGEPEAKARPAAKKAPAKRAPAKPKAGKA